MNSGHNVLATVFVQSGENMYRADGPAELKPVGEVEFVNGIAAMAASGASGALDCTRQPDSNSVRLGNSAAPAVAIRARRLISGCPEPDCSELSDIIILLTQQPTPDLARPSAS